MKCQLFKYNFFLFFLILAAGCGDPGPVEPCENGLNILYYPDCRCPEGEYSIGPVGNGCVELKSPNSFVVGGHPGSFFNGYEKIMVALPSAIIRLVGYWTEDGFTLGLIDSYTGILQSSRYKYFDIKGLSENVDSFVINIGEQIPEWGVASSGQALFLTGKIDHSLEKPANAVGWKWIVRESKDAVDNISEHPVTFH